VGGIRRLSEGENRQTNGDYQKDQLLHLKSPLAEFTMEFKSGSIFL
jgi:hypothetical protein